MPWWRTNQRLAALLVKALLNAGIESDVFRQIEPASLAAAHNAYAVLIIDRGLPDGDGLELVRRLRAAAIRDTLPDADRPGCAA